MANIRLDLDAPVHNGQALTFRSPTDCSRVAGITIYYPERGATVSKIFQFADAHGNNVGSVNLFSSDVLVKVILDTDRSRAYVQNADTNAYLEGKLSGLQNTKQNKLSWVTEADIDAMIAGKYKGEEDESSEAAYAPANYQITDTTTGEKYNLYVENGDLKMEDVK